MLKSMYLIHPYSNDTQKLTFITRITKQSHSPNPCKNIEEKNNLININCHIFSTESQKWLECLYSAEGSQYIQPHLLDEDRYFSNDVFSCQRL